MVVMTRSNHLRVAKIIRNNIPDMELRKDLAQAFAEYLKENNQFFDKKRFWEIVLYE